MILEAALAGSLGLLLGIFLGRALKRDGEAKALRDQVHQSRSELLGLREELDRQRTVAAQAQAEVQAQERRLVERQQFFDTQIALSEKKQAETSQKLLQQIAQESLKVTKQEQLRRDAEEDKIRTERQKAFNKEFESLRTHLTEIEKERAKEGETFKEQFRNILKQSGEIQMEAARLTTALENARVQGDFGELRLERVLEFSGLREGIHYTKQEHVATDDGALRPDVLVHLADGNRVVIDSKAPLSAFFAAIESSVPADRERHLKGYAKAVKSHVKALGGKAYQNQFSDAAPFTVMFLPSEAAFLAALEGDPSLLEFAVKQDVLIATASTLVGLLKVVHIGHRQLEALEESERILTLAKDVFERGHKIVESTVKVGKGLKAASEAYSGVVASYETRFLPKGRELAEYAKSNKSLPAVTELAKIPPLRLPDEARLKEGEQLAEESTT